eukprot:CAMPEP_0118963236 /NCGR_PEP_ID=MMETSP1173-20130426/1231_1 /TAXON_ID=1034831 /ORGANISM="Rhizochromulina marina cf, Strain CCMP1243" /LENGTH=137 /DNA_ID=CAMNT_0006911557 /DNA_START=493 /DNA_END=904 /DNA_ORIENTATION=-
MVTGGFSIDDPIDASNVAAGVGRGDGKGTDGPASVAQSTASLRLELPALPSAGVGPDVDGWTRSSRVGFPWREDACLPACLSAAACSACKAQQPKKTGGGLLSATVKALEALVTNTELAEAAAAVAAGGRETEAPSF